MGVGGVFFGKRVCGERKVVCVCVWCGVYFVVLLMVCVLWGEWVIFLVTQRPCNVTEHKYYVKNDMKKALSIKFLVFFRHNVIKKRTERKGGRGRWGY